MRTSVQLLVPAAVLTSSYPPSVSCSCEVIRDWKTGDSLCYAFIEFEKVRVWAAPPTPGLWLEEQPTAGLDQQELKGLSCLHSRKNVRRPTSRWTTC